MDDSESIQCHWCLSGMVEVLGSAVVAPWILENSRKVSTTDYFSSYCRCNNCGLCFFSRRFSKEELNNLYSHYRDSAYQKNRQRYEPWYTKKVNQSIGHDIESIKVRQGNLEKLIREASSNGLADIPRVIVDWGGDKGQFIPVFDASQKSYVYEVSNATPTYGVERLTSTAQISEKRPDLIMLCHVIEHDHDARNLVCDITKLAKSSSLLYVEIPLDRPKIAPVKKTPSGHLFKHRFFWIFRDFYSLVTMRLLRVRLPFQILKQGEHVNFFCEKSLVGVVESLGFKLIVATEFKSEKITPVPRAFGALFSRE